MSVASKSESKGELALRTGDNLAGLRCNIYRCHGLIVAGKLIFKREATTRAGEELNLGVTSDSKKRAVTTEGVIRNRLMEKKVSLWGWHNKVGAALDYRRSRDIGDAVVVLIAKLPGTNCSCVRAHTCPQAAFCLSTWVLDETVRGGQRRYRDGPLPRKTGQ